MEKKLALAGINQGNTEDEANRVAVNRSAVW